MTIEDKWAIVPENTIFSKKEIKEQVYFQERFFDFIVQL